MSTEVKLPELGENVEEAQVLTILVSPGDKVEKDQPIIELETDKATAEVPSEVSGVVGKVMVKEGDTVRVGQVILVLDAGQDATAAKKQAESKPAPKAKPKPEPKAAEPEPEPEPEPTPTEAPVAAARAAARLSVVPGREAAGTPVAAAPSVRRLARELGIDIAKVPGSGSGGRISEDDVKAYARGLISRAGGEAPAQLPVPGGPDHLELPDFSAWGEVEREPMSKIKKVNAASMATSWSVIPHVTQFDKADITELNRWRKDVAGRAEAAGGKLTVTAMLIKVIASALKVYPRFNSSLDTRTSEVVLKKYVNIGVAVDTPHGLLVPVIKNADQKNIVQIAADLTDLSSKARDRKASMEELTGANLNVSNLGSLGTTYFSPIVNWPQVAVIGVGRAEQQPVYVDGAFVPRLIMPLAVSYDHRVVDGADAARFLHWIVEALEQPMLLALEG